MRQVLPADGSGPGLTDAELEELYAFGPERVLRTNFVSTLDGAATGSDHLSGSINDAADKRVYDLQRRLCDVVLVGAGTAVAEGYRRPRVEAGRAPLLVVVSAHARVPQTVVERGDDRGAAVLVTCRAAGTESIAAARAQLGEDGVWVVGTDAVDLAALRERLHADGHRAVLCEGGPTLHGSLLAAGLVDELAVTLVGRVVGGSGPRITAAPALGVDVTPRHLLAEGSTLLGLWEVRRDG